MYRSLLVMTAGLALCVGLARADDEKKAKAGKATITPVSLLVTRTIEEKDFFYSFAHTELRLRLSYPGKQILGIEETSKITEMQDDKKTSLMGDGFFKAKFNTHPSISKDRNKIAFTLSSNANPGKGATKVAVKGSLVLRCGTEEKSVEKEVELKNKTEAKFGPLTLKVTAEKGFADGGATFTLVGAKPDLKSISIKDADGKEVEAFSYGPSFFDKTYTYTYNLRKAAEKAKVKITYFSKSENVTVPIDLSVGLGL
jgi:hypothetical protein